MNRITIYFDGACEPRNPGGTAVGAWIVEFPSGEIQEGFIVVCSGEGATNNVAEWAGLLGALKCLNALVDTDEVEIFGDSMLVINQLTGKWRCKKSPHLAVYRDECQCILKDYKWSASWIPREQNSKADAVSRRAY